MCGEVHSSHNATYQNSFLLVSNQRDLIMLLFPIADPQTCYWNYRDSDAVGVACSTSLSSVPG